MFMDRRLHWLMFFGALALSLSSLYFEFVVGLKPCPLCIMQRLAIFLLTLCLLLKVVLPNKKVRCGFAISSLFFSLFGLFFAVRQVYLQSLPASKVPACGPSLEMLMKYFPWQDTVHALFYGSGDCAKIDWTFLGGSMAFWSMIAFIGFASFIFAEFIQRYALMQSKHK